MENVYPLLQKHHSELQKKESAGHQTIKSKTLKGEEDL
jgi:hypothetical protein